VTDNAHSPSTPEPPAAWQPFTFGGVAAFARARWTRLLAAQLAVALLVAACGVWLLHRAYCPIVLQAIQKMPETACVAGGTLLDLPVTVKAESQFMSLVAETNEFAMIGQDADLQIVLRPKYVSVNSVFWPNWGWDFEYVSGASLNLARSNLEPWWSAWQPVLLAGAGAATVLALLLCWAALALVYMAPAKFMAWVADRFLTWGGAWRLASAALLPGAVVMAAALLLYGWRVIDLLGLAFLFSVHVTLGWIYLVGGSCKVTRLFPDQSNRNPFTA
jgi:hypothetical protein